MAYQKEVFVQQLPIVDRFARHLIHYRAIKSNPTNHWTRSWFWTDTCDAHLLQASMCWCMVFGSPGQNETHLRHLAIDQADELQKSFRAHLLTALRISAFEWESYWTEMLAFRNKYAAHRELGFKQPVPIFDRALETALCYDEWVREVIYPDVFDSPPLRQLVSEWQRSVGLEVSGAIDASTAERRPCSGPAHEAGR